MKSNEAKVKYKATREKYEKEKSLIDRFLFSSVPSELLQTLKRLFNDVVEWEQKIYEAKTLNAKQKQTDRKLRQAAPLITFLRIKISRQIIAGTKPCIKCPTLS